MSQLWMTATATSIAALIFAKYVDQGVTTEVNNVFTFIQKYVAGIEMLRNRNVKFLEQEQNYDHLSPHYVNLFCLRLHIIHLLSYPISISN